MELNLNPKPQSVQMGKGIAKDTVVRALDLTVSERSYRLLAQSDGIILIGGSDLALDWADNTLAQLRRQFPEGIPCLTIHDTPEGALEDYLVKPEPKKKGKTPKAPKAEA